MEIMKSYWKQLLKPQVLVGYIKGKWKTVYQSKKGRHTMGFVFEWGVIMRFLRSGENTNKTRNHFGGRNMHCKKDMARESNSPKLPRHDVSELSMESNFKASNTSKSDFLTWIKLLIVPS